MNSIFIPQQFWHLFPNEEAELVTVRINGYAVKGYHIKMSEEKYQEVYGDKLAPESRKLAFQGDIHAEIEPGDCSMAYFFAEGVREVAVDMIPSIPLAKQDNDDILKSILASLDSLAEIAGKRIWLHVCKNGEVHYPHNDKHIHVIVGGMPPGESREMWASYICDTRLHPQGNSSQVRVTGVAQGYGKVVTDGSDNRIAQVVGNNLYLCLPIGEKYLHLLAANGTSLFREVLQLAWNAFVDIAETAPSSRMIKDDYLKYLRRAEEEYVKEAADELKRMDEDIERLRAKVHELILQRNVIRKRRVLSEIVAVSAEEAESGWNKLSAHRLVNFLERSGDGNLHVHTKDIIVLDDSNLARNLGRFIIRVVRFNHVTVWSELLTHPMRIPHPHISVHGSVCFGNVTSEIDQLVGEGKEAELVCLILLWLEEGYDADLADTKIETWPLASEVYPVLNLDTIFLNHEPSGEGNLKTKGE